MLTEAKDTPPSPSRASLLSGALEVSWLGQTIASLAWIASVFSYGISATGDWLQLLAASAWLISNVATLTAPTRTEDAP